MLNLIGFCSSLITVDAKAVASLSSLIGAPMFLRNEQKQRDKKLRLGFEASHFYSADGFNFLNFFDGCLNWAQQPNGKENVTKGDFYGFL